MMRRPRRPVRPWLEGAIALILPARCVHSSLAWCGLSGVEAARFAALPLVASVISVIIGGTIGSVLGIAIGIALSRAILLIEAVERWWANREV